MIITQCDDKKYIAEIVQLHLNSFKGFFLTQLGRQFLTVLYTGYLDDPDSGIIIARNGEKLVGFLAYSMAYSKFYKKLLHDKKKMIVFISSSIKYVLSHPTSLRKLLFGLKKSESVERKYKYVELASIAVDQTYSQNGIGTSLIQELISNTDFVQFPVIILETDAVNNDHVNSFYVRNGFQLSRTYKTNEGRLMNEYQYTKEVER